MIEMRTALNGRVSVSGREDNRVIRVTIDRVSVQSLEITDSERE